LSQSKKLVQAEVLSKKKQKISRESLKNQKRKIANIFGQLWRKCVYGLLF